MLSLYQISSAARIFLLCLLFMGLCAQLANLVVIYLINLRKNLFWRQMMEIALAFHFFVLTLSVAIVQINASGNLLSEVFPNLRLWVTMVPILAVPIILLEHRSTDLLAMACTLAGLPFMEQVFREQYAYLLIYSTAILFLRAMARFTLSREDLRHQLSRFSMKEAFDSFPEALAIAGQSGRIILMNKPMRALLEREQIVKRFAIEDLSAAFKRLCERDRRSDLLSLVKDLQLDRATEDLQSFHSGERVYRVSEEPFLLHGRPYRQIMAVDITREFGLLEDLLHNNLVLQSNNQQLEGLLENIEVVQTAKETYKLRNRIHDVLGQRLSILHMYLQQMDSEVAPPPVDELLPMLEDIVQDFTGREHKDPKLNLEHICNALELVGTKLHIEGELPTLPAVANVFLQIIREATTNAIRHGQATNIYIQLRDDEHFYYMDITNDGSVPPQTPQNLREGDGIGGMRFKLKEISGQVEIQTQPRFGLKIKAPKFL